MINKKLGTFFYLVGVAAGLFAIFKIVVNVEIAIGFVTISFGLLAIIWTTMAIGSLSQGSSLRKHTTNFLFCLIFILLFAIWHTLSILFQWRKSINEFMLYPGYLFITLAFLIFVISSYQILMMGKEFGFGEQAFKIKEKLELKKQLKTQKSKKGSKAK